MECPHFLRDETFRVVGRVDALLTVPEQHDHIRNDRDQKGSNYSTHCHLCKTCSMGIQPLLHPVLTILNLLKNGLLIGDLGVEFPQFPLGLDVP